MNWVILLLTLVIAALVFTIKYYLGFETALLCLLIWILIAIGTNEK